MICHTAVCAAYSFAELDRVSSRKAVVVFRPIDPDPDRGNDVMSPSEFYQRMLVMDAGRQMLNAERPCATQFGGDPSACPAILQQTAPLYALPSPSAEWARGYCSQFGVQYIAVSHRDPDWGSNSGWPVALPVIAQQDGFKILRCAPDPR